MLPSDVFIVIVPVRDSANQLSLSLHFTEIFRFPFPELFPNVIQFTFLVIVHVVLDVIAKY